MNLAHRKSHGDKQLNRSESFSKSKRPKKLSLSLRSLSSAQLRKVGIGATLLALIHVVSYMSISGTQIGGVRRHLAERHANVAAKTTVDLPKADSPWYPIVQATKRAEQAIVDFFHGDAQALANGVPIGGTEDSTPFLTKRLARRIALCRANKSEEDCSLTVAFIGSAQMSGHDVFFKDSFPFLAEQRLRPVAQAAGLELKIMNNAQDSDRSKEGPQSTHMCVSNFVGESVDVIAWDLDNAMQGAPPAQFEAFVRWAFASNPAMIMINRGGPHARSRRGTRKTLFNIGPNHDADIWEDDPDNIPEQREEPYVGSDTWKEKWEDGRNEFWNEVMDQYSGLVDFAAVDPTGSIWTLDHLQGFSNGALDAGKALPFLDCGNEHEAPCDQVPPFVAAKLEKRNVSLDEYSEDQVGGGALCSALFGCRNILYGGPRSHVLRGELNALPIVRSFRFATAMLASPSSVEDLARTTDQEASLAKSRALSLKSLPPPKYCAEAFCNAFPTCMTSYLPNLGQSLSNVLLSNNGTYPPATIPRMGAAHFADNPEWAVDNLEKRDAPLGYADRKYAYRLTEPGQPIPIVVDGNVTEEFEPEDSATSDIAFVMNGEGTLVLCEPPCFMGICSKMRRMPLVTHVTMELDGEKLELTPDLPSAVEANGPFCKTIATNVTTGDHILRLTAITKAPHYTMFSHLITFS